MNELEIRIVQAAAVRRSLTNPGDIRTEVAFQNDINALLARFDEVQVPWRAMAGPSPALPILVVADATPMPTAPLPRRGAQRAEPAPVAATPPQRSLSRFPASRAGGSSLR